jgi:hypothetical protein
MKPLTTIIEALDNLYCYYSAQGSNDLDAVLDGLAEDATRGIAEATTGQSEDIGATVRAVITEDAADWTLPEDDSALAVAWLTLYAAACDLDERERPTWLADITIREHHLDEARILLD